jgi:hypothetical protein
VTTNGSKDNTTNILLELYQIFPGNIKVFKFPMDMPILATDGKKVTLLAPCSGGDTGK